MMDDIGLYGDYVRIYKRFHWDTRKKDGNYYFRLYRVWGSTVP